MDKVHANTEPADAETIVHADGTYLPEAFAYGIVLMWHARNEAKTWSEYRRLAPPSFALAEEEWDAPPYEHVRDELVAGLRDGSISLWRGRTMPQESEPTEEEVLNAYSEVYGTRIHPDDDDAFDEEAVPSGPSGAWIERYMNDDKSWVPRELWERFGSIGIYRSADWTFHDLIGEESEIVEALREHGFTVREDPNLILATALGLGEPEYGVVLQRAREVIGWW